MTTKTLQECIPEAQRAYNRANAKLRTCHQNKHRQSCLDCRLYLGCDIVAMNKQTLLNLNELKRKTEQNERTKITNIS